MLACLGALCLVLQATSHSEEAGCPRECNMQGVCSNSTCDCYPGWSGADCSMRLCPAGCSNRGSCHHGKCRCAAKFTGDACERLRCPEDCTSAKRLDHCTDGVCHCKPGFSGTACELSECPDGCSGNGECDNLRGTCKCSDRGVWRTCSL